MEIFDPCAADEETKRTNPSLKDAYDAALEAIDAAFDSSYWRAILASSQTPEPDPMVPDHGDLENDPEMQQAIEMGIINGSLQVTKPRLALPAPQERVETSFSDFPLVRPRNSVPDPHNSELSLPLRRRPQPHPTQVTPAHSPLSDRKAFGFSSRPSKRSSPSGSEHTHDDFRSPAQRRKIDTCAGSGQTNGYSTSSQSTEGTQYMPLTIFDSDEYEDDLCALPRRKQRILNAGRLTQYMPQSTARSSKAAAASQLTAQEIFDRNGLHAPTPAAPDADVIEGDL